MYVFIYLFIIIIILWSIQNKKNHARGKKTSLKMHQIIVCLLVGGGREACPMILTQSHFKSVVT